MNDKTFIMAEAEFSLVVLFCLFQQKEVFLEEQGWREGATKAMKPKRLTGVKIMKNLLAMGVWTLSCKQEQMTRF